MDEKKSSLPPALQLVVLAWLEEMKKDPRYPAFLAAMADYQWQVTEFRFQADQFARRLEELQLMPLQPSVAAFLSQFAGPKL
jgi:hypothetical protein